MPEGSIKRLTDKGFGFIDTGTDKDMFFHSSNLEGVSYDELQEGQRVSYTEGHGPKGPRAENVQLIWQYCKESSLVQFELRRNGFRSQAKWKNAKTERLKRS